MKIKKIKIKVANQEQPVEIIDIGADAINIDYNNTTIKAELDRLNTVFDNYYDKDSIDNLLDTKVEKINGKDLSTNDFTNTYRTKLDGLENYDDTDIREDIAELAESLDETAENITQIETEQTTQNTEIEKLKAENIKLKKQIPTGEAEGESIDLTGSADEMEFLEFDVSGKTEQETGDVIEDGEVVGTTPSPDYPSEIKNVEGNIEIKVTNGTKIAKLPSIYTELEYIESTGEQYIDTGAIENEVYGMYFEFMPTGFNNNYQQLISGTLDAISLGSTTEYTQVYLRYRGVRKFYGETVSIEDKNIFQIANNEIKLNNDTYTADTSQSVSTRSKNICLFSVTDGSRKSICRVYLLALYGDNDILIRYMIPCKRNDNVIGMYDLVNDVFYTNAGTGTFIGGDEIENQVRTLYIHNKDNPQSQTIQFPLAEGQKMFEGDYLADDGIHHVIEEMELDSKSITWGTGGTTWQGAYIFLRKGRILTTEGRYQDLVICDKFTTVGKYTGTINYMQVTDTYANLSIIPRLSNEILGITDEDTSAQKEQKFKNWLDENKPVIQYELKEEQIDPYTEEQQIAYNKLKELFTYKGTTFIYTTNEVKPTIKVKYYKNTTTITDRLDLLEARVTNLK